MSGAATPEFEERRHWFVRGALLLVLVILVVSARVLLGSHSLRETELPQRVALLDAEPAPQSPPPLAEPEPRQAPPDEARGEGLDVDTPTTDAGLGPTDTQLAVDAEAEAGFDSFGLGAKRGGRDLALDLGKSERAGSGGSAGFTNYAAQLGGYMASWLNGDQRLRRSSYALHARIWLDPDGNVERCILLGTTGDTALDAQITARLSAARPPNGPPPGDLPQPINLLIRSRVGGN